MTRAEFLALTPEEQKAYHAAQRGGGGAPAPAPAPAPATDGGGAPAPAPGPDSGGGGWRFDPGAAFREPMTLPTREQINAAIQGARHGVTLGYSNEIDAALSPLFGDRAPGQTRAQDVAARQAHLDRVREANPGSFMAGEVAGTLAPALIPGVGTALAGPRALSVAGRVGWGAATGAGVGAVEGFGRGEGGFSERAANAVPYALGGGVAGAAAPVAGVFLDRMTGWIGEKLGRTLSQPVRTEMQRLMERSGMSAEEIVERVGRGETFPEMSASALTAVKEFTRRGGPAANIVKNAATQRASSQTSLARQEVERGLRPGADVPDNMMAQWQAGDEAIRAELGERYTSAYAAAPEIATDAPLAQSLQAAFQRVPHAADELNRTLQAMPDGRPLFGADGSLLRPPSLKEVEIVRGDLRSMVDTAYRNGQNNYAKALEAVEGRLRADIDLFSPSLAKTRAEYATQSAAGRAFKLGQSGLTRGKEQFEIGFEDLSKPLDTLAPDAVSRQQDAARMGLVQRVRETTSPRQTSSMLDEMLNPQSNQGANLRTALPPGAAAPVETALEASQRARRVKNELVTGRSDTGELMFEGAQSGAGASGADQAGNFVTQMALGTLAGGGAGAAGVAATRGAIQAAEMLQTMTQAQRNEVANIIMSENPDLWRRALAGDTRGFMEQAAIIASRVAAPAIGGPAMIDMMMGAP